MIDPDRSLKLARIAARWYERYLRAEHPGLLFSVRVIERERGGDPVGPTGTGHIDGRISGPDDPDAIIGSALGTTNNEDPLDETG